VGGISIALAFGGIGSFPFGDLSSVVISCLRTFMNCHLHKGEFYFSMNQFQKCIV